MKFTKMHGIGNDYVYMDCTRERLENPGAFFFFFFDIRAGLRFIIILLFWWQPMMSAAARKGIICLFLKKGL